MELIRSKILNSLVFLEQLAEKCKLLDNGFVRYSLYRLSVMWDQRLAKQLYSYLINSAGESLLFDDVFDLPGWGDLVGELVLGSVIGNDRVAFNYSINKLPMHILAGGTSGSGKTNFAKVLIEKAHYAGISSIKISDPKSEYEDIAMKHPEFILLRWNELRFNPFIPPLNVPENEWWQCVIGHMSQCFNFWAGGESLLIKLINKVAKSEKHPTLLDLLYALNTETTRFKQKDFIVMGTVASRLELMINTCKDVVLTRSTILPELMKQNYILQTSGLMSEIESWLLEFLILWESMYRLSNHDKRQMTLHVYDECQHRLFSSEKERNIKKISSSMISMLVDEARALNMGIVALSQEPSMLVKSVLNNSWLKIAFHLGSGQEVKIMKNAMGLSQEQAEALFYMEVGEGIIRMAGGGYMDPFPVKFNKYQKPVDINMEAFWKHQHDLKMKLYKDSGIHKEKDSCIDDRKDFNNEFKEDYDVLG